MESSKLFVGKLCILLLSTALLSCNSKKDDTIIIGIGTWPGFCTAMVGQKKGFFDQNIKIQHKILDHGPARHAAFRNGQLDIMISSLDVFAMETAQGIEGEIILITDESWGNDGIIVKNDINSFSDLMGKNVVFAHATPSQFLLYQLLLKNDMLFENIQPTAIEDPLLAAPAFLSGSVDAAVTWEPFLSEIVKLEKGKILATSKDIPNTIVGILVANRRLVDQPELIKAFLDGWLKSVDYIKENPDEAKKIIAQGLRIKEEDADGMMAGLKFADKQINIEFFETGKINTVLESAFNFWKTQGIIDEDAQIREVINQTALQYFSAVEK